MRSIHALLLWVFWMFAFVLTIAMSSCTTEGQQHRKEQKLARLIKANPGLVTTDTVKKDTLVQVPELHENIDLDLSEESDSLYIDRLTRKFYGHHMDSGSIDTLNQGFRGILSHSGDIDTTVTTKSMNGEAGSSKVHIIKKGTKLNIDIVTTPPPVEVSVPVAVTTIKVPVVEPKWYHRIFIWINRTFGFLGWALLLLLGLILLYMAGKFMFD